MSSSQILKTRIKFSAFSSKNQITFVFRQKPLKLTHFALINDHNKFGFAYCNHTANDPCQLWNIPTDLSFKFTSRWNITSVWPLKENYTCGFHEYIDNQTLYCKNQTTCFTPHNFCGDSETRNQTYHLWYDCPNDTTCVELSNHWNWRLTGESPKTNCGINLASTGSNKPLCLSDNECKSAENQTFCGPNKENDIHEWNDGVPNCTTNHDCLRWVDKWDWKNPKEAPSVCGFNKFNNVKSCVNDTECGRGK